MVLFSVSAMSEESSSDDSPSSEGMTQDANYLKGRQASKDGRFEAAIKHLLKAAETDPDNSDVYNLLGYNYRSFEMNDQAFRYYRKALELNPRHRGAHEYIGELYLKLGKLSKAKKHLEHLDSICFFGCEEYDELKEAILEYEAKNS